MSRPRLRFPSAPRLARIAAAVLAVSAAAHAQVPAGYAGTPWHDSVQVIPGILEPEKYDEGASGITWFDTGPHIGAYTARNSGVDLDPVKTTDPTVPGSAVKAVAGNIYWGWLENNEWLKMTVNVKQAGTYAIHAMVGTAMNNTSFKVDALQGTDSVSSGALVLPFTGTCPVECYHYWNYVKDAGEIQLKAGIQVVRLQIVKSGYNIEYVELQPKGTTGLREAGKARGQTGFESGKAAKRAFDAAGRNPGRKQAATRLFIK
jgi:hypothetical protein